MWTGCGPSSSCWAATHPVQQAHDYLALLAVHPARQSRGLGGWLLHEHHRVLDRDAAAGYLHAPSTRSRDFYRRAGWRMHGGPFEIFPGGPLMYPMMRDPRPVPMNRPPEP
jgi:GNAT superfamily N-acetyltransferase